MIAYDTEFLHVKKRQLIVKRINNVKIYFAIIVKKIS